MTPERQRIKLAEWDGWSEPRTGPYGRLYMFKDNAGLGSQPPAYLSDLDAVHGLLPKLTEDQLWKCIEHLVGWKPATPHGFPILSRSESIKLATATAGEWCEALLKTLGLWEETK